MDDTQLFPPSRVPPTREAQRLLFERRGQPDAFDVAYDAAWRLVVDDGVTMKAIEVESFLGLLQADERRMAGQGAERLMRERSDLHESICAGLDNVLNPPKWLQDEAALGELTEDIES